MSSRLPILFAGVGLAAVTLMSKTKKSERSDTKIIDVWTGAEIPGSIKIINPSSNGNRPVLILVPDQFNRDENAKLLLYFHGYGGNLSTSMMKYDRLKRVRELVKENPQMIIAMPQSANKKPFTYWMNPQYDESFSGLLGDIEDAAKSMIGTAPKIKKLQVEGHSAGGGVISRLAKNDQLKATKITLHDGMYSGWGPPLGRWAKKNNVPVDAVYRSETEKHNQALKNSAPSHVDLHKTNVGHEKIPGVFLGHFQ